MVAALDELKNLASLQRDRVRGNSCADLQTRLALIDKIADLAGVESIDRGGDSVPYPVDVVFKRGRPGWIRGRREVLVLCSLSPRGVAIFGLDPGTREDIVSERWGEARRGHVLMPWPGNQDELAIVWSFIQKAHAKLYCGNASLAMPDPGAPFLPQFSRTYLH